MAIIKIRCNRLIEKYIAKSITAVLCVLTAASVQAQSTPRMIEEVIVSATKRDTMLQDTPIAVTAFGQGELEKAALTEVSDLASAVPNLSMGNAGFSSALEISMRGITTSSNTESSNPAVSVNLDGVYIPRSAGANALFYDVERVEVLRGPQGTLFGRNSTAGAINVVSKKPTDQFEASVRFEAGNYDQHGVRGVVNLPVNNSLSLRTSLQWEERDGYFDHSGSPIPIGKEHGAVDQFSGRLSALFTPTDEFSWLLVYEANQNDGTAPLNIPNPVPEGEDIFRRPINFAPELNIDFKTLRSRIDWDFSDNVRFTYTAGLGSLDRFQLTDFDGGINAGAGDEKLLADFENDFSSHDIQLQSSGDGALEWTIGAFYFEEENDVIFNAQVVPRNFTASFENLGRGQKAKAFYGQGTYSISNAVRVTAGARYTEDTKYDKDANFRFCPGADVQSVDYDLCSPPNHLAREEDFDQVTWRMGLDWDLNEEILLYGSVATGFKSGGFSNLSPAYDEETVITTEAGLKGSFLDNTLRLNAALFASTYKDLQVSQVIDSAQVTTNAAEAKINGLELEALWLIGDNTQIDGFVSWLDAEFDEYLDACDASQGGCSGPDAILLDLSGNKLNRSPEWSFNLGIEHEFALAGGTLTPRLSVHWEDDYYLRVFNRDDIDRVDSWTKTDFTLKYEPHAGNWGVQIFAKNLQDDAVRQTANVSQSRAVTNTYSTPRTYGVKFDYRWGE
ncbi:TonB-dependent receptor [Porticoccaceae bacterium]|nr:TonB-dependent receptor [Porticoccaceae bacterium]